MYHQLHEEDTGGSAEPLHHSSGLNRTRTLRTYIAGMLGFLYTAPGPHAYVLCDDIIFTFFPQAKRFTIHHAKRDPLNIRVHSSTEPVSRSSHRDCPYASVPSDNVTPNTQKCNVQTGIHLPPPSTQHKQKTTAANGGSLLARETSPRTRQVASKTPPYPVTVTYNRGAMDNVLRSQLTQHTLYLSLHLT